MKGTITSIGAEGAGDAVGRQVDKTNKLVTFTNSAPLTDCTSEMNNE